MLSVQVVVKTINLQILHCRLLDNVKTAIVLNNECQNRSKNEWQALKDGFRSNFAVREVTMSQRQLHSWFPQMSIFFF